MKMTRKQRQIKENTASINTMLCCNGNCVQAIRSLKLWALYCCWQKIASSIADRFSYIVSKINRPNYFEDTQAANQKRSSYYGKCILVSSKHFHFEKKRLF